ncbi:MAG: anhydro-N-acetylmuramic acid kinase [Acidobacteriales bacterium]|nr:anhydro-N-acetylmuramic acid kinase [Terriglobales bacterium]
MSGTSADGIDVALVRVRGRRFNTRFELLRHEHYSYPVRLRRVILQMMNAGRASVADLSRLNFRLGEVYAEAVLTTERKAKAESDLIGCHGQTIYHQGELRAYLGAPITCTWQIGEGAIIAARTGRPVLSDFRPADMAVGGKGAPLVPFLDYALFRHTRLGRIVQNIGGIGNLTAIPARATPGQVIALDTGPGNMVIDALAERFFRRRYDPEGTIAARGKVHEAVLRQLLRMPFFQQPPPRTAGREEFGREFVTRFINHFRYSSQHTATKEDMLATATALTAASIADSIQKFVLAPKRRGREPGTRTWELIASGGGTHNRTLMRMIAGRIQKLPIRLRTTDEFGLPSEAKEAVAFAVLAYQTWNQQAGNIPSATGARRAAVLGKVSYPPIK